MSELTWDKDNFHLSPRGTRVYWAVSSLQSPTPNGRYEIEKLGNRHWSVTHYQVTKGGNDQVVRHIGWDVSKRVAERLAWLDYQHLAENVLAAVLNKAI